MLKTNFIPPSGIVLLEGLTRLTKNVTGILDISSDGTHARFSTANKAGAPALQATPQGTRCVTKYRVLNIDNLAVLGKERGAAKLYGSFVDKGTRTVGVVGAELVAFENSDLASSCSGHNSLSYGVQTSFMPLAPVAAYASGVWSENGLDRALIACANGIFILQKSTLEIHKKIENQDKSKILSNLLALPFILDARPDGAVGGVICRLSQNAIAILAQKADMGVLSVMHQRMGVTMPVSEELLPASGSFLLTNSILEILEVSTDRETLLRLAPILGSNVRLLEQSLDEWQAPPLALQITLKILPVDDSVTIAEPITESFLLHAGSVGIKVLGTHPPVRPLRPGEFPGDLEKQLTRILIDVISKTFSDVSSPSQESLDSFTAQSASLFRELLSSSGIFSTPSTVGMSILQVKTRGKSIRLPSGLTCVIPEFALSASEPRMAVVLACLPALGVFASFTPWASCEGEGLVW
jgi:hypothetical protein